MKKPTEYDKSVMKYCIGAVLAGFLTAVIYVIVVADVIPNVTALVAVILLFALVQLCLQLYFFLHITDEEKPRWKSFSLWYVIAMLLIVVVGSIWVMRNMDYNMGMTPEQMQKYMLEEGQKGF